MHGKQSSSNNLHHRENADRDHQAETKKDCGNGSSPHRHKGDLCALFRFYKSVGATVPSITPVSVDGQPNAPGNDDYTIETLLDIDVSGSVAPGAKLAVYFAPWSEKGWVDAVTTAIQDKTNKPAVLSISYGWPENETIDGLTWSLAA